MKKFVLTINNTQRKLLLRIVRDALNNTTHSVTEVLHGLLILIENAAEIDS